MIKSLEKNKLFIASALSVLMIIPLYFIINNIIYAYQLTKVGAVDPSTMNDILTTTIYSAKMLSPFIFFMSMLIIQIIIATYLIVKGKTKREKIFGYLTLIIGGLGINVIFLFISKNKDKETTSVKFSTTKKIANIGLSIISPIAVFAPVVLMVSYEGIDKPTSTKVAYYSTNKSTPNVIEIFTDGFDPNIVKDDYANDSRFNDFAIYPKFVTSGAETSYSLPTLVGGISYNNFMRKDVANGYVKSDKKYDFPHALSNHLSSGLIDQKYLINLASVSNSDSYMADMSGDPAVIADIDKNIKVVNWREAQIGTASGGISNHSPDSAFYEWLKRKSRIKNGHSTSGFGARVFIQDLMTHLPRITGPNGNVVFSAGRDQAMKNAQNGLRFEFSSFFEKLKNTKDKTGRSVYDNSLIMIYGDHASHSIPVPLPDNNLKPTKYNSMLMIKYPDQKNKKGLSNREIYAPFIGKIIDDYLINKDVNFIETNKNFNPGREFIGFFRDEALVMKYVNDELSSAKINGKNNWIIYNKKYHGGKEAEKYANIRYYSDNSFGATYQEKQSNLFKGVSWVE